MTGKIISRTAFFILTSFFILLCLALVSSLDNCTSDIYANPKLEGKMNVCNYQGRLFACQQNITLPYIMFYHESSWPASWGWDVRCNNFNTPWCWVRNHNPLTGALGSWHNGYNYGTCLNPPAQLIICNSNSDCGTNGFVGNLFCSSNNVFQNYKTYICNNAGTTSSYCSSADSGQLKQDCGDSYCDLFLSYCKSGNVYHSRTCYDKGCSDGACFSNSRTEEVLVQTCSYGCSNGICNQPNETNNAPIISNIQVQATNSTARITWGTDILSDSVVNFGLNTSLGTIISNSGFVLNHIIDLLNLEINTTYYYNVKSCNSQNNCTTSGIFNFKTLSNQEQNNLAPSPVTNLQAINITNTSILWTWTNPSSSNFKGVMINIPGILSNYFLNNTFNSYLQGGLVPDTEYTIIIKSLGFNGLNSTDVSNTARTLSNQNQTQPIIIHHHTTKKSKIINTIEETIPEPEIIRRGVVLGNLTTIDLTSTSKKPSLNLSVLFWLLLFLILLILILIILLLLRRR